jgi:spoIIIJ-associated protein
MHLRYVDIQAFSVEEAVRLALEQLGCSRDEVKVEVLATDPGGEEVLVRVTAPDKPGDKAREEARGRRTLEDAERDRVGRAPRLEQVLGPRRAGGAGRFERPNRYDRRDRDRDRHERPARPRPLAEELEPGEVEVDSALQPTAEALSEHATPQDAVAPIAAEILQKILQNMKLRARIVRRTPQEEGEASFPEDEESVVLNVVGLSERDQSILIGRRGETLDALQFIVNLILSRKVDLWARVVVDVEGYRLRRKLALINLAKRTAEQVVARGQAIPLEAMPAHERRVVHMALAQHPSVTTESTGVEPERRVVVMPR